MLPFLMLEEGVPEPNAWVQGQVKMLTSMADGVKNITLLVGTIVAFLCMGPELFLWMRSCCSSKAS